MNTDYIVPPMAAGLAIIPPFKDMIKKSALQKGTVSKITTREALIEGAKAAPIVGAIVGSQMILQKWLQKNDSLAETMKSSFQVGVISSPLLAIFNGMTMGKGIIESGKQIRPRQIAMIALQETAFVGGLAASDIVSAKMKEKLGDNIVVKYAAVFLAGCMGSLAGHPANTALTRWQSGLKVESARQLMWGSATKARAVGVFAVIYNIMKENLM